MFLSDNVSVRVLPNDNSMHLKTKLNEEKYSASSFIFSNIKTLKTEQGVEAFCKMLQFYFTLSIAFSTVQLFEIL